MGAFKDVEREEMEHFESTLHLPGEERNYGCNLDVEPTDASIEELTDRNTPWRRVTQFNETERTYSYTSA